MPESESSRLRRARACTTNYKLGVPLVGLERILVPAADVEMVEFEKPIERVMELHSQIEATAKIMIDHNSTPVTITKEELQNDATLKTCA